jgi:hypothetical protein
VRSVKEKVDDLVEEGAQFRVRQETNDQTYDQVWGQTILPASRRVTTPVRFQVWREVDRHA